SALAQLVAQRAAAAAGRFSLGLSGGSLVRILSRELPAAAAAAAPARWLVAFCDERLVPAAHPESTSGAYRVSGAGGPGSGPGPIAGPGPIPG
ncbi:6PGL phosphogluconolactonase, partial [Nothoprocta ornata]|nr:6PGL phosphogluconolactonase [Nothoprocta ornata]